MEHPEDIIQRLHVLPKWAQKYIDNLRVEINRRDGLVKAHALLCDEDRNWFTLPNKSEGIMKLWLLNKDNPFCVCSLDEGDTLIVGRKKK